MNPDHLLTVLRHGNQLKRTARTGWAMRGVVNAESVAAHSYGVAFTALILAAHVAAEVDVARLLALALIHDLPEALTSDIPAPVKRLLPEGAKTMAERQALQEMLGDGHSDLLKMWEELNGATSAEASLIHDADRLDMLIQCRAYEEQTGNRQLAEFWAEPYTFHYPIAQEIYGRLLAERAAYSATSSGK